MEQDTATAVLTKARLAPTSFAQNSPDYWKAVANQTVRTYINLIPEPRTTEAVAAAIAQCASLKDLNVSVSSESLMIFLEPETLGETQGPFIKAVILVFMSKLAPPLRHTIGMFLTSDPICHVEVVIGELSSLGSYSPLNIIGPAVATTSPYEFLHASRVSCVLSMVTSR